MNRRKVIKSTSLATTGLRFTYKKHDERKHGKMESVVRTYYILN